MRPYGNSVVVVFQILDLHVFSVCVIHSCNHTKYPGINLMVCSFSHAELTNYLVHKIPSEHLDEDKHEQNKLHIP